MKANVEIRYKVVVEDKEGKYQTQLAQVRREDMFKEKKLNPKRLEVYCESNNRITIPLPNGEKIMVYIDG